MKNFSQSILPPWNVPRLKFRGGHQSKKRVGVSGLFPEFREGFGWRTWARGGLVTGRSEGRERRECIFRSARVPAGSLTPPPCFFDAPPTGYFAFCYIIAGFDYAKRRPPQAVCTLLPSLLLLSLPRLRSRPLSLPGHVGGPSSPLTFRGKPHLRIFIGIIPARFMKIESGSPISRTVSRLFFLIF